mgnify:CR=1 FL=1
MKAEVLLDLLSGKPVTRREIRQQTGYPDREIRQTVRDLRLSGVEEEYIPFRNAMISRVVKIMEVVNAMDRNLNGQVRWGECTGAKSAEQ